MRLAWAAVLFTLLAVQCRSTAAQEAPKIFLVGSAEIVGDRLRLTREELQSVGAAWIGEKQYVADGFEAEFDFQIIKKDHRRRGADGFAFVLQSQGIDAIAGPGSAGGFAIGGGWHDMTQKGIPHSVAVFFDMHQNPPDPSDNYIAICTNGAIADMEWPPSRLGKSRRLPIRMKDGRVHRVRIKYKPPMMMVFLNDGEPVVSAPVDIRTVTDSQGRAYVGFTASTGEGFQIHDIMAWFFRPFRDNVSSSISTVDSRISFLPEQCLKGKNLCTPPQAVIEPLGPNHYRVYLPAHLPWPASIPNPAGLSVEIANARGFVCLDLSVAERCGGSGGLPGSSFSESERRTLLQPSQAPGALILRSEHGRVLFSVNGASEKFRQNEGFLEFEAVLR